MNGLRLQVVRILICDDAAAYATLLAYWIGECDDLELCGVAHSPGVARTEARRLEPDVILLDHLLGPSDSHVMVPLLRDEAPAAKIVLVSGLPTDVLADVATRCGADAHISKGAPEAHLLQMFRDVVVA